MIRLLAITLLVAACGGDDGPDTLDPATAPRAFIDRFAPGTGTMMVRDGTNSLPAANAPIDADAQFLARGLGPAGQPIAYYAFDVQSREASPLYLLYREGEQAPVDGQLPIIDRIPGDTGYTDFWLIHRATVPADYVANEITSYAALTASGSAIESLGVIENHPVVPAGSTATMRIGGVPEAQMAWYRDTVAHYFDFGEQLTPVESGIFAGQTPISYIYVTFNINPDEAGGGLPSGFRTEPGSSQTHNVVETIPGNGNYSPLWIVYVYDTASFDTVTDIDTAHAETIIAFPEGQVNCPVVMVGQLAGSRDPS